MIDPKNIDLPNFLATWYGAPSKSGTPLPDSCDWLPEPLKEWHTLTRRWDVRLTYTTSMIPPERIRIAEDGKAIFMIDSTGDWRWCIDPNDSDSVFDAELYAPWERNSERLTDFLVHNIVREVVCGANARMRALAVSDEALAEVLAPLEEVEFGTWKWPAPGYRIFMGDETLAEIIKADSGTGWDVDVVSPKFDRLSRLEKISGARWRA
ncbi:hypothetical protein ACH4S8_15505 [Streptomyces sp. NPDC021080]|uniref:hypothetical protein n=1 Tax=Streptomyces sp. NPDC021080 TaxID=3365110 RepID=UPI003789D22B